MAEGKLSGPNFRKLRHLVERSVRSFSRHDMAVYAMALAYRGLLALFPFAIFLVAWSASCTSMLSSAGSPSRVRPG